MEKKKYIKITITADVDDFPRLLPLTERGLELFKRDYESQLRYKLHLKEDAVIKIEVVENG